MLFYSSEEQPLLHAQGHVMLHRSGDGTSVQQQAPTPSLNTSAGAMQQDSTSTVSSGGVGSSSGSGSNSNQTLQLQAGSSQAWRLPRTKPYVIAHRGASGDLPEHTLEGYKRAIADGG